MRYQELNESYHDQRIRDALNWQNPEDFDWIAEDASEELGIEIFDISEDEFNKFIESEWYQDKLFQAASNSYQKIMDHFEGNTISVWREITAESWNKDKPVGEYWSWGQAEAYCADSDIDKYYLFNGVVSDDDIDWGATIWKNAPWGLHDEQEIHIIKGSKISIKKILVKNSCSDEYKLVNPKQYQNFVGVA